MAFGQQEATGLVVLVLMVVLAALIARAAVRSHKLSREASFRRTALMDLEARGRIGTLRHRDFDQWFKADQERRRLVGLPPLDREVARKRQFDPTFELDVPAPRGVALKARKGELREVVLRAEDPVAADPTE